MRTLFLNPPSFEGFDGGASSRWPAAREIESYWYPVWLCYPAGLLPDSKVVDAPPHKVSIEQTVAMAKDFELLVLFTSSPGFDVDIKIAEMMKDANAKLKVAFVGPPVTIEPEKALEHSVIDFVVRREFDYQIADYARGKPLEEIAFYTTRGCPAMCTFCLWPQTHSGHRWRVRSSDDVAREVRFALEAFPQVKEIFFDDDTFNYQKARTIDLCSKLKPLKFTWSCTSRVTTDYDTLKAMKEAGCRLLIVGYESGDPQILKNIKKGATIEMAQRFTANCKKLGLVIHGDFIIGLPGETRETIRRTIDFAKRIDPETIQVSLGHAFPGTEFYEYAQKNELVSIQNMADEGGHQLPNVTYTTGLSKGELMNAVERFYDEYYFRPRVIWRVVRKAVFNTTERRRLTKEAREYLALRSKRKRYVSEQQEAATPAGAGD